MKPTTWKTESCRETDGSGSGLEPGVYAMVDALQDQLDGGASGEQAGSIVLVPIAHAKGQIRVDAHLHLSFRTDPCMTHPAAVSRAIAAGLRDLARHVEVKGGVEL